MARERLRIGIVGCGDVAHRHYLPGLASMSDEVQIVGLADPRPGAPEALAAAVAAWSPQARAYAEAGEMLAHERLDGVFDLTPAPLHGALNRQILEAGAACYSEKPIAASVAEATELIELAASRGILFLCATGTAVTSRFRWLRSVIEGGELGRPTLAVAHHADAGPAAWAEYTGDPAPFYREGVGPVFDHGVYRLHEMTFLLGPVRRVQAMGSIAVPRRRVRGGPRRGQAIEVTTPDHVLIHLEFAGGALGQLLASFGTLETLQPWLELHLTKGVVSFGGKSWEMDAPTSIYRDDPEDADGVGEWTHGVQVPRDELDTVAAGARHFLACLLGRETPVLTAEHARHVLDVILKAYASIGDGAAHATETTF
ncbi:MAG TPA: Gfo/Idh/MocA family oxidoreductase [Patescibacteria group bacterium]|nr:Gfo/Idh/MocA family oxidoreductase [Patescibacteria group bacterium]